MYVCMHGPNVHTSKAGVCMFVGDIEESYIAIMYVCPGKHTYPVCMYVCRYVCMYVCPGNIHTEEITGMYGMYVYLDTCATQTCMWPKSAGSSCNTGASAARATESAEGLDLSGRNGPGRRRQVQCRLDMESKT